MTTITSDAVRQLAQLSAIALDDNEVENLRSDIEAILGYVEQLGELDTAGVEPTYQVTGLENVWRDDIVDGTSAQQLVSLAPSAHEHQFKVPKVL